MAKILQLPSHIANLIAAGSKLLLFNVYVAKISIIFDMCKYLHVFLYVLCNI